MSSVLRHRLGLNVPRLSILSAYAKAFPTRRSIKAKQNLHAQRQFNNDAGPKTLRSQFPMLRTMRRLGYLTLLGLVASISYGVYLDRHPQPQVKPDSSKKSLVILGTGWASVSLLKSLDTENYNVIVISPRNYFLFTPLLPSCTTGTIEHRSIMEPIRSILTHRKGAVTFYEAEASSIDPERKVVKMMDNSEVKGAISETEVPYDMLVIGVGAENATCKFAIL